MPLHSLQRTARPWRHIQRRQLSMQSTISAFTTISYLHRPTGQKPGSKRFVSCLQRGYSSHAAPNSSVNAAEVQHFDALSSTWWDPHGPMRLLHLMNPLRHDFIRECRSSHPTTSAATLKYIDVGCGGGIFAESAARLPTTASVTALDPSPAVLQVAKAHAATDPSLNAPSGAPRLRYLNTSIEGLPVPTADGDKADVLALWEVIEHVDRPDAFLRACLPHVKPGGWLVLSTIARTWASWITTKVVAEDVMRIVPRGTHDWHKYINEEELQEWFAKQPGWGGQGAARVQGCMYLPTAGWTMVPGAQKWGNYFFGVWRDP